MVIENRDRFSNENGAAHCPDNHSITELGGISLLTISRFLSVSFHHIFTLNNTTKKRDCVHFSICAFFSLIEKPFAINLVQIEKTYDFVVNQTSALETDNSQAVKLGAVAVM